MKTIIKLRDAVGKQLTSYYQNNYSSHICLFFGDEVVCCSAKSGYDGDLSIEEKPENIDIYEQRELGLITEEEFLIKLKERDERQRKSQDQWRRQQYEQLKKIYDPENK